jgi:hypothetical protein
VRQEAVEEALAVPVAEDEDAAAEDPLESPEEDVEPESPEEDVEPESPEDDVEELVELFEDLESVL